MRSAGRGLDSTALARPYFLEVCCSTTQVQRRRCLRSAAKAELIVPRSKTATRQRRTFSVAGPAILMGFLPLFAKYQFITLFLSYLPSRRSCLLEAGLGALPSRQS